MGGQHCQDENVLEGQRKPGPKVDLIKGSVHQNLIDGPLIFNPGIVKRIMGFQSETSPVLVLDLYAKLMLHFIYQHLDLEVDKDVVAFLEHHDSVLIEASEDVIAGDDADL